MRVLCLYLAVYDTGFHHDVQQLDDVSNLNPVPSSLWDDRSLTNIDQGHCVIDLSIADGGSHESAPGIPLLLNPALMQNTSLPYISPHVSK